MRITLSDVAKEAGVSVVTVSRVINGTYPDKVGAETRQKVLDTIERLNYKPNVMARGLLGGRTYLIGVAINNVADSFFGDILQGIHDAAAAADLGVLLGTRRLDVGKDESALRELESRGVDGIIYYGTTRHSKTAVHLAREGLPLVQICNRHEGLDAPYVMVDHFEGAYMATKYLLGLGHRRIAHVGAYLGGDPQGVLRLDGYKQALLDSGVSIEERLIIPGDYSWESGYDAAKRLLEQAPDATAIFASSDFVAVGAMRALQEVGYHIPGDMALIGFDDMPFSAWQDVPLTTIAQPKLEIGKAAVDSLVRLIDGQEVEHVMFEPRLIIRESCGTKASTSV